MALNNEAYSLIAKTYFTTKMHSSRNRTARFSGRLGRRMSARGVFAQGVCRPKGVSARGVTAKGGGCLPRRCACLRGVVRQRTCENITLPQTLFAGGNKFKLFEFSIGRQAVSVILYTIFQFTCVQCVLISTADLRFPGGAPTQKGVANPLYGQIFSKTA